MTLSALMQGNEIFEGKEGITNNLFLVKPMTVSSIGSYNTFCSQIDIAAGGMDQMITSDDLCE